MNDFVELSMIKYLSGCMEQCVHAVFVICEDISGNFSIICGVFIFYSLTTFVMNLPISIFIMKK